MELALGPRRNRPAHTPQLEVSWFVHGLRLTLTPASCAALNQLFDAFSRAGNMDSASRWGDSAAASFSGAELPLGSGAVSGRDTDAPSSVSSSQSGRKLLSESLTQSEIERVRELLRWGEDELVNVA